jgi:MFS family permease
MDHEQTSDGYLSAAIAKATYRLIPFLCLAYTVNFLDRVNVGFAALHMNADLGFSPAVFGFGAGIFFLGYIVFEIPSNLALQRFGARIWIARIMISWGLIACAMALVRGETSFYVSRLLLGIAEAGFFPGIILYLTYWFPAGTRARIIALFMASVPLATVFGGPISGVLLQMHGFAGLAGWQWLFIIEGAPAVLLGVLALFVLTDKPDKAAWLSENERRALTETLASEAANTKAVGYADLRQALKRPRVLALGVLYFLMVTGLYGIGLRYRLLDAASARNLRPRSAACRLSNRDPIFVCGHRHGAVGAAFRQDRRAPLAYCASAASCGVRFRLVRLFGAAPPHHDRAELGNARLLRRVRAVLVAAHGAADGDRRCGGHRAGEFHGERGGLHGPIYRRALKTSDGKLLGGAAVLGGRAGAGRPDGAVLQADRGSAPHLGVRPNRPRRRAPWA